MASTYDCVFHALEILISSKQLAIVQIVYSNDKILPLNYANTSASIFLFFLVGAFWLVSSWTLHAPSWLNPCGARERESLGTGLSKGLINRKLREA